MGNYFIPKIIKYAKITERLKELNANFIDNDNRNYYHPTDEEKMKYTNNIIKL